MQQNVAVPTLLLAADVDHFVGNRLGIFAYIVEFTQVAGRNAEVAGNFLEGISVVSQDVVHAVGTIDVVTLMGIDRHAVVVGIDRPRSNRCGLIDVALAREPVVGGVSGLRSVNGKSVLAVEQVTLFDDADESLRIVQSRSVTGGFQSPGPTFIIVGSIRKERVVARLAVEKFGMILIGCLDRRIAAETFALFIVVVIDHVARPVTLALDSEMVVRSL